MIGIIAEFVKRSGYDVTIPRRTFDNECHIHGNGLKHIVMVWVFDDYVLMNMDYDNDGDNSALIQLSDPDCLEVLLDCLESVRVPRVMSAGVLGLLSVELC